MKAYKSALFGVAILAMATSSAMAADVGPAPADQNAATGFYLRGDAGWSFLDWSGGGSDSDLALGVGLGYRINDALRTDLRADYSGPFKSGGNNIEIGTLTGNLYYDIDTGSAFTPYLGAGAGYGYAWRSGASDRQGVAFALMAGAGFALTDRTTLDIEYRFRDIMSSGADPMEHQILAGIRYAF
jgi:opacity protein-like surface antigen